MNDLVGILFSFLVPFLMHQVKYSFMAYQKSGDEIRKMKEKLNDPKWRPPPLCVMNVSISCVHDNLHVASVSI